MSMALHSYSPSVKVVRAISKPLRLLQPLQLFRNVSLESIVWLRYYVRESKLIRVWKCFVHFICLVSLSAMLKVIQR